MRLKTAYSIWYYVSKEVIPVTTAELDSDYSKIFPFWSSLPSEDKELMSRFTVGKSYSRGANIHGSDGECTGAIVIKSGCVRAYLLSEEGREITLYRLFAGDICMLSASCVLKAITFDVMVDADTDCECFILNGRAFSELADKNIYVKNYALETAVGRFSEVMWVMQQILFMSFDRRLAIFLSAEIEKSGGDTVKLSNEQIAKYMGSAREVVSRMMKYFSNEGIAERTREGIRILDREKLRGLAG